MFFYKGLYTKKKIYDNMRYKCIPGSFLKTGGKYGQSKHYNEGIAAFRKAI